MLNWLVEKKGIAPAKTASQSRATWMIIKRLLHVLCRRDVAAFLLKAFPLEYEDNVTHKNSKLFERRQRALVRLYRKRLGFVPVPDPSLIGNSNGPNKTMAGIPSSRNCIGFGKSYQMRNCNVFRGS